MFPSDDAKTARTYFHQFRHQLKGAIPDVSIDYDDETRLYFLTSKISIEWDVSLARAGEAGRHSQGAVFLPDAATSWVKGIREDMSNLGGGQL